jgi:hypothetical protein
MENQKMGSDEIHLARFPFGGGKVGAKLRPVLLLTGPVGPVPEVLVAYMTSVLATPLLATDIVLDPALPEHATTNLSKISLLRLHKVATIHQSAVVPHLGKISPATRAEVEDRLRLLLRL